MTTEKPTSYYLEKFNASCAEPKQKQGTNPHTGGGCVTIWFEYNYKEKYDHLQSVSEGKFRLIAIEQFKDLLDAAFAQKA